MDGPTGNRRDTPPSAISPPPSPSPENLRHVERMINSNHYTSPSRTIYSDRFIPSRSASKFALFDINTPTEGRDDSSSAYTTLLRTALFGPDAGGVAGPITPEKRDSPSMTLPSRNIFRYKTETRQSMHSLSPFMSDDVVPGVNQIPVKAPRKVPRSPYKVLDAPALQDDFYLNLVDWSSHNVLAFGLGMHLLSKMPTKGAIKQMDGGKVSCPLDRKRCLSIKMQLKALCQCLQLAMSCMNFEFFLWMRGRKLNTHSHTNIKKNQFSTLIQDFVYLYDPNNETAGTFMPALILYDAFHGRYQNSAGAIVLLFVIWGSFFFGGLSIITTAARVVYALPRD